MLEDAALSDEAKSFMFNQVSLVLHGAGNLVRAVEFAEKATARELGDLLAISDSLTADRERLAASIAGAEATLALAEASAADQDAARQTIASASAQLNAARATTEEIRQRLRKNLEGTAAEYEYLTRLENIAQLTDKTPDELRALRKQRATELGICSPMRSSSSPWR